MILADTGYWVALFDRDDHHHARAVEVSRGLHEQLAVTWPVLTETVYFLGARYGSAAVQRFLELGERGGYQLHPLDEHDLPRLRALIKKYADLPMDLAAASLVLLAERTGEGRIFSTDQRDFRTYRFKQHKPFRNLLLG
ncbi:MAG: PIN domain-containing protein [Thermomonas sp.]|uniref:type II toxin-antitoxin system VapC family toxin n=1 Tax=Thermomonas sp. TaxID=1971895 RepID=UPI001EC26267|nr:PIN domain-containing protein [Thermomonas sp.]MBV2208498.1 PIN domain-containing protein [Thermomonas sp.]